MEDHKHLENILIQLKSNSSKTVQDALLKIRNKIIINDNGVKLFRECGGLEYLVPHLRKPNEKILDLTLSILGNCCLDDESCLVVGKLNSCGPLISIVKTVRRDSIIGRACRVIGNLAHKISNAETLHNHGAVSALVSLIEARDKRTSYPVLTMAVRALRQLWIVPDKRDEMLNLNAVRCIAILLITECESAGIINSSNPDKNHGGPKKSQEELINGIIKCLGYFTTHSAAKCAEQIQGDGRGYKCLVALTKTVDSMALKCLLNLCYISTCRPLLGTAGLVDRLVGLLKNGTGCTSNISWWPEGAARALAQLSGESVNRSRLRHCGGLSLLVAAAKDNSYAMHALLQYVFDDTSFQILINEGLVSLLTDELKNYLTSMNYEHSDTENNSPKDTKVDNEKNKEVKKSGDTISIFGDSSWNNKEQKPNLFTRRKSQIKNEDSHLKVVIERDNMIVGFIDAVDSDASGDSQSEDESLPIRRKVMKRGRSGSPKVMKKKSQLIKMASKDWSAGVYWEPKSPEWSSLPYQNNSQTAMSPNTDRMDRGPTSPYSDGNQSGLSPSYSGYSSNKKTKWDWSPESGMSLGEGSSKSPNWNEYQWSPSSSGSPTSPFSATEESSDSEVSGRYSPVCSEAEVDNDGEEPKSATTVNCNLAAELETAQVAHDLDELIMNDDDSVDDETTQGDTHKSDPNTKYSRIACVLILLFRVSHGACSSYAALREEPVSNHTLELLTGRECLNALLDYVERCKRPLGRAARILARVLSNALCLVNILRHRLVLRLHNMSISSKHPPSKCKQCKQIVKLSSKLLSQLTILTESSYGIGEISYQFYKGTPTMKETLSLTLPYIVRNDWLLKKYFVDCSALNVLFGLISKSKEDIQDCVTALFKLATNVNIKDPKTLEYRFKEPVNFTYDPILDNLSLNDIVTFELDDQTTLKANKLFLCQNSDVFSAMLMGCFKESIEKCVRLKNVSKPALEHLLTLLHCGLNNQKCDVQIIPMASDLKTNLEVLLLADRFLFDKLKDLISSAILQFQMTPENAAKIYIWSLREGMGFLCVESVAYLLTGKMCETQRSQSFQTIMDLEYKEQWLDDIKSLIFRQLVK